MKSSNQTRRPRVHPWLTIGCAALSLPLAIGCASPGPPHPPSLRLPELVKDLTATRIGDQVELHWTTPTKTTDKIEIKGSLTAEICRASVAGSSASSGKSPCVPVTRLPVQAGDLSHAADSLPSALTLDPPVLLSYQVRIFNNNQHSAGLSLPAFAASGAAPPPVADLHATPVRLGAMLQWKQQSITPPVELDRLIDGATVPPAKSAKSGSKPSVKLQAKPTPQSAAKSPADSPAPSKLFHSAAPPVEVKLRTPQQSSDPGGTIDHTAESGVTYRYTAQRVRSLTLDGHALEIRSLPSPTITVLVRDIFPPQVPHGLEAVPGGDTPADASIDLSWEPNTETDLAGYIIYRQEVSPSGALTGTAVRLNSDPTPAPAYRDKTAIPNQRYAYRVSAIDTAGNESAQSTAAQETRREQ